MYAIPQGRSRQKSAPCSRYGNPDSWANVHPIYPRFPRIGRTTVAPSCALQGSIPTWCTGRKPSPVSMWRSLRKAGCIERLLRTQNSFPGAAHQVHRTSYARHSCTALVPPQALAALPSTLEHRSDISEHKEKSNTLFGKIKQTVRQAAPWDHGAQLPILILGQPTRSLPGVDPDVVLQQQNGPRD